MERLKEQVQFRIISNGLVFRIQSLIKPFYWFWPVWHTYCVLDGHQGFAFIDTSLPVEFGTLREAEVYTEIIKRRQSLNKGVFSTVKTY